MANPALCAKKISVELGGHRIVHNVSLELAYNTFGVIAGPNGAGKSTFLRALLGLIEFCGGRVQASGKELDSLTPIERARLLGYVPQTSELSASLRVGEVVGQGRFARREPGSKTREAVDQALVWAGMSDFRERSYLSLSGGERRLVLIARALCTEARILLLDEPTAGLDIANRLRILALLQSLVNENYAVLAVLHELDDVVTFADHVTLLHKGTVAAAGTPDKVVTEAIIRDVYEVELKANGALGFALPGESP